MADWTNLNELSPFGSPPNGLLDSNNPFSLSFGVDVLGLQSELDQWTNTSFGMEDFNSNLLSEFENPAFDFNNVGNSEFDLLKVEEVVPEKIKVKEESVKVAKVSKKRRSTISAVTEDGEEEANSNAVEEDKRKRNTAASGQSHSHRLKAEFILRFGNWSQNCTARFRIKKKQREAALESTAKELTDKVTNLEAQILLLQTENGWLKGLIVDKSGWALYTLDLRLRLRLTRVIPNRKQALLDRETESEVKQIKIQLDGEA